MEKYEKLQQLRSIERAIEQIRYQLEKFQKKYIENNLNLSDEQKEYLRKKFEEFQSLYSEGLESQKKSLEQELQELGFTEEVINQLRKESLSRLRQFIALYRVIKKKKEINLNNIKQLRQTKQDPDVEDVASVFLNFLEGEIQAEMSSLESAARETPEAFLAYHLLKLREYKRSLESGKIVLTPWVERMKNEVISFLNQGRAVFLWGETGSGKTEFSKLISQEYSGGFEIIRGHRFMTKEELFGYLGLSATEPLPAEKVPQLVEEAIRKFKEDNPGLSEEELQESRQIIEQTVIRQASDPVTITKFFWGPVYRAMKDGKVLIIDEANYIPPGLMASLNPILANYRPGMKIAVPETGEEIIIKEGFAVILTGNLNVTEKEKYTERYLLDPALRDRVKLVEYNTPPQEYKPEISFDEPGDRDLFLIAVTALIDEKGNLVLPNGEASLEKVWKLCQAFKLFQDIFAGKEIGEDYQFTQQGRTLSLTITKNNLSMRKLLNILTRWKQEGFSKSLDYYVWDEVIAQAMDTPQEAAYFYQIFQKMYGFFQTQEWDQNPNYGTRGEIRFDPKHPGKIDETIPFKERNLLVVNVIRLVEALSGEKIPEIKIEEDIQKKNLEYFEKEWLTLNEEFERRYKELKSICSSEEQPEQL